jgi:hypothetical protein
MTRAEAEAQCAKLAAEHPDRETHRWLAREDAGGAWSVVKVGLPPADSANTAETRADQKPATADDPRSSAMQNLGPHAGTGF